MIDTLKTHEELVATGIHTESAAAIVTAIYEAQNGRFEPPETIAARIIKRGLPAAQAWVIAWMVYENHGRTAEHAAWAKQAREKTDAFISERKMTIKSTQ